MAAKVSCRECGAGLDPGPTLCPLCGADVREGSGAGRKKSQPVDVDEYQKSVRALRDRLRKLREDGAEAV